MQFPESEARKKKKKKSIKVNFDEYERKRSKKINHIKIDKVLVTVDNFARNLLDGDNYDHHSLTTITNSDNENTLDQCYKCIICGPMFFQSKKKNLWKRLWRTRVTTSTNSASPRQQHHRPEPYSQAEQYYQLANETSAESYYYPQQRQKQNYHRNCGLGREEGSSLLSSTTAALRNCCTNSNSSSTIDLLDRDAHQLFRALMNQLKKDSQLETLCQAIEGGLSSSDVSGKARPYQPTDCVLVPRQMIHDEEPQVIACRLWRWSDLYDPSEIKRIPKCPNEKDPIYVCCNPAHWSRLCQPGNDDAMCATHYITIRMPSAKKK